MEFAPKAHFCPKKTWYHKWVWKYLAITYHTWIIKIWKCFIDTHYRQLENVLYQKKNPNKTTKCPKFQNILLSFQWKNIGENLNTYFFKQNIPRYFDSTFLGSLHQACLIHSIRFPNFSSALWKNKIHLVDADQTTIKRINSCDIFLIFIPNLEKDPEQNSQWEKRSLFLWKK